MILISHILPSFSATDQWLRRQVIPGLELQALLLWLLVTPVQFIYGWRFYVNAFNSLKHCATNMDVLVSLGTTSAYIYSTVSVVMCVARGSNASEDGMRDAHFFETSAMLISFILLGKYLESKARPVQPTPSLL